MADLKPGARRRRNRQRGFSLLVVFLLVLVMVGVSAGVMLSTQGDLQVSGHDRESVSAIYAAEAGVAWAQSWLQPYSTPVITGTWTPLLQAQGALPGAFCVLPGGGVNPPTALPGPAAPINVSPGAASIPAFGAPVRYDAARNVFYQWCVHNNAADPAYNPVGAAAGNTTDGDNIITIESWGWVGGDGSLATASASTHISVDLAYSNANLWLANDYGQSNGVGGRKDGRGETSSIITGGLSKNF